jgi:hypothetical protein
MLVAAALMTIAATIYPAMRGFVEDYYLVAGYFGMMVAFVLGVVYLSDRGDISKTFSYLF